MDENTEARINSQDLPISGESKDSLRIQRAEYVRRQLRRRKEREDKLMAQLIKEQSIIDRLQEQIDEDLEQTEETVKFNRELRERMSDQVYTLHGVSRDKLEGIEQYRDAWRRGSMFSLFILSLALVVLCGVLHGFDSQICVFMLAGSGVEGALIAQDRNGYKALNWLCRFLGFLMFPAMLVMFTCYELGYEEYGIFLPYAVMGGAGVLVIAMLTSFIYDPYSQAKRDARAARVHLGAIEKAAKKEVQKNRKRQAAEEKKTQKRQAKSSKNQPRVPELESGSDAAPEPPAIPAETEIEELPEDFSLDEPEHKKSSFLSKFRRKNKTEEDTDIPAEPDPAPAPEPPKDPEPAGEEPPVKAPELVSISVSSRDEPEPEEPETEEQSPEEETKAG